MTGWVADNFLLVKDYGNQDQLKTHLSAGTA